MPTRIRLQRHGKKGYSFYHIVVADSRSPRDGKFIEKIGTYNSNTNPATIELDFDRALNWVQSGAEPTETCRAILSYKGVLMKDHLLRGVTKGALTADQADAKYNKWVSEKEGKITGKKDRLSSERASREKKRLAAEGEVRQAREKAIAAKNTPAETPAADAAADAAVEQDQNTTEA